MRYINLLLTLTLTLTVPCFHIIYHYKYVIFIDVKQHSKSIKATRR